MRTNHVRRALVVVEPAMLGTGIAHALGVEGFELMSDDMTATIRETASRTLLLHPSARPDVVVAGPALAADLVPLDFTIVEVSAEPTDPVVAYARGSEVARVPASLRAVVELALALAGAPHGSAAMS